MAAPDFPPTLYHVIEPPRRCSYLPEQTASLEYRSYRELTPFQLEYLLERGWRRFGIDVFRPACANCMQCIPIRVDVNAFQPSKSQRRTLKKNGAISVQLQPASVTLEHVSLYNSWHAQMATEKNWPAQTVSPQTYAQGFLTGEFPTLHDILYFEEDELVGVGLVDRLPNSLSSVYFYHAPRWRDHNPGTFSLMCEIEIARQLKLKFVYLGYWINECTSMAYKSRFHPHEVLLTRPKDEENASWLKGTEEQSNFAT
ncbi:arginyltransferase [Planctomicrobium sp. SH668]|uniref:arginyltransferase n=1 Tax=Planctomicrobium sp. SH668 TaxID=3448126 RepID=UPI003F5B80AF